MRASVANLLLATNASHIILYKENIERETFGHSQTHGSLKQGALSSAGALGDMGQGGLRLGEELCRRENNVTSQISFCFATPGKWIHSAHLLQSLAACQRDGTKRTLEEYSGNLGGVQSHMHVLGA